MMSKLYFVAAILLGVLSLQANAHAIITPALGVSGQGTRNDVQRPSKANECGNVNVANTINTSTPVKAAADGSFTATITNFNAGVDGSRQVTALVDASGTGKNFVPATVTQNGDKAPTDVGSQQLAVSLPPGTKCIGGNTKDLCLVSFTTAGGFGNCVAVQQAAGASGNGSTAGAAAAGAAQAASGSAAAGTTATAAGAAASGTATTGKKHHHHKGAANATQAQEAKAEFAKLKAAAPRDYSIRGMRFARAVRRALTSFDEELQA